MNKEQLQTRITEIEEALAKVVSNHSVLTGQLAEAKHWLATLDKSEEIKEVEGVVAD